MTMPHEERDAIHATRNFLREILSHNLTYIRNNPKKIREGAMHCLRHFPWDFVVDQIWQKRIEMNGLETNWSFYTPREKGLYLVEVLGGDMTVSYWNGEEWDASDKVVKWVTIPK